MSGNRTNLRALQNAYLIGTALEASQPKLLYSLFAEPYPLPVNEGSVVEWFRYLNPDEITAAAAEGVTPPPASITRESFTATVTEHIWWTPIKSQWKNFDQDKKGQANLLKKLMQTAARSVDSLDALNFCSGTSVFYAGGVAARASIATTPAESDLDRCLKILEEEDAEPVESMIMATSKEGTVPIDEAFIGITHVHGRGHFEKLPNFVPVHKYAEPGKRLPGEIGAFNGRLRICVTSKGYKVADIVTAVAATTVYESTSGTNPDAYTMLIFGKEAFGTVPFKGQGAKPNFETIIKELGSSGSNDPGNQRGSLGVKHWHASRVIDETKVVRYEFICKVTPS